MLLAVVCGRFIIRITSTTPNTKQTTHAPLKSAFSWKITRKLTFYYYLPKRTLFDLSPRSAVPVTVTIAKSDIATVNGGRDSRSTTNNRHVHSTGFYCYLPLSCAAIPSLNILCSSSLILQPIYFSIIINFVSGHPAEVDTGISSLKTRPKSIYWDVSIRQKVRFRDLG